MSCLSGAERRLNTSPSSFLPQDKVPEFARMTPEELLRATEEAAGDKDLKKWHDKLITLGQEVTKMTQVRVNRNMHLMSPNCRENRNASLKRLTSSNW